MKMVQLELYVGWIGSDWMETMFESLEYIYLCKTDLGLMTSVQTWSSEPISVLDRFRLARNCI